MHRPPTQGVEGSKPRLPNTEANGEPASKEEIQRLSREYLITRNRQMSAKAFMAETQAAKQRGELIDKKWAFDSLSYLLVCFRQRTLLAPRIIARRLVSLGLADDANEHAISRAIESDIHGLLTELSHLPEKVTNPDWFEELERENGGTTPSVERQQTPAEHKREQGRATRRREKKTETMRELREQGRA
jgi:hypothetical protein